MIKHGTGQVFHVTDDESGCTLAAYIKKKIKGTSWAVAERWIRNRWITIHGNICLDAARRLKKGEVVKFLDLPAPAPPGPQDIKIVHLDDHVVVVDKPAGITTTRHHEEAGWPTRRRQLQPTLDELLPTVIGRFLKAARQGNWKSGLKKERLHRSGQVRAVHRIDRETSGLLVFARTVPAGRILAEQFRQHTTDRKYLAIAVGHVGKGTIISSLVRDRGDGRRGSAENGKGKHAVTHVRPCEHFADAYTLVECRLETGRTHQIRIHLAESGHPICGERVYSAPVGCKLKDQSRSPRVALHAAELGFIHPVTGDEMFFHSRFPKDLQEVRKKLVKIHGQEIVEFPKDHQFADFGPAGR